MCGSTYFAQHAGVLESGRSCFFFFCKQRLVPLRTEGKRTGEKCNIPGPLLCDSNVNRLAAHVSGCTLDPPYKSCLPWHICDVCGCVSKYIYTYIYTYTRGTPALYRTRWLRRTQMFRWCVRFRTSCGVHNAVRNPVHRFPTRPWRQTLS